MAGFKKYRRPVSHADFPLRLVSVAG